MPNITEKKGVDFFYYPKFLYTWPLIVAGYLCYAVSQSAGPNADVFLGWVYTITVVAVVTTLGIDLRLRVAGVVVLAIALGVVTAVAFGIKGYAVASRSLEFLHACTPRFDRGGTLLISITLSVVYILMYIWVHLFQRVHIGAGGAVIVKVFGESATKYLADNRCFSVDWPDTLEWLLGFGAGQITIRDRASNSEIVLPNVPLLAGLEQTIEEQGLLEVEIEENPK
ncbi:MAG: hypothetical protein PHH13_02320 [Candidatus Peribacteraceae bacterium]|nr:hypothetical protein [Candidatus Peribacteraceae bacterium]